MSAGSQAPATAIDAPTAVRRSPGRPTREQAIERDRELLETALDLFLENGFEGTSIEMITAAVGMAKRTIYSRYDDKRGLFRAALQRAIDEWILPIDRLSAAEGPDLEQSLNRIGRLLIDNILSREGLRLLQITNAEARRLPGLGPWTSHLGTEPTLAFLEELLGRRLPGIAPADAALSFLQLVVGGPATYAAWGQDIPAEELDRRTAFNVRLFLNGVGGA